MVAINVRLPDELHQRMTKTAKDSFRSLNGEIIHRLQNSYEQQEEAKAVASLMREALSKRRVKPAF